MAQVDYYLKIAKMDGEATDEKHKGELEIESYSWGVSNSGTAGHGGGAGAGKAQHQDFHFVKKVDKASPKLMLACSTGEHIPEATLSIRKAGGTQHDYLIYKFNDCLISSYSIGGSGGDVIPTEQFSMNFAKVNMEYKEQKSDGSLGGSVKQGYDFSASKKL